MDKKGLHAAIGMAAVDVLPLLGIQSHLALQAGLVSLTPAL
jgi:hypothetical protein